MFGFPAVITVVAVRLCTRQWCGVDERRPHTIHVEPGRLPDRTQDGAVVEVTDDREVDEPLGHLGGPGGACQGVQAAFGRDEDQHPPGANPAQGLARRRQLPVRREFLPRDVARVLAAEIDLERECQGFGFRRETDDSHPVWNERVARPTHPAPQLRLEDEAVEPGVLGARERELQGDVDVDGGDMVVTDAPEPAQSREVLGCQALLAGQLARAARGQAVAALLVEALDVYGDESVVPQLSQAPAGDLTRGPEKPGVLARDDGLGPANEGKAEAVAERDPAVPRILPDLALVLGGAHDASSGDQSAFFTWRPHGQRTAAVSSPQCEQGANG